MFLGQSFQTSDIASVVALVLLEGLLSADNAVVLAIMVRHLPKGQQQKALLYGLVGAFAFRLIAILLASFVLRLWWLQAAGAAYLLFLPFKHFLKRQNPKDVKPAGLSFWRTVFAVEITDMAFAVDSVLAGVTFVGNRHDKVWVVYVGAVIGIVLLRFAAASFIKVIDRYPILDHVAYVLVGWVGVKLAFLATHNYDVNVGIANFDAREMPHIVFWSVLAAIVGIGTWLAIRNANPPRTPVS